VTSTGTKTEIFQISDVRLGSCADGNLFLLLLHLIQQDNKRTQIVELNANWITVASMLLVYVL